MSENRAKTLLHPVRLQILMVAQGRRLTTQQFAALLPDIPQASLYRHVAWLHRAGILVVAEETPVRGALERVYTLDETKARVSPADIATADPETHLHYFTAYAGMLMEQFRRYVQQPEFDIVADGLAYSMGTLTLNDDEYREMVTKLREALEPYRDLPPAPGRRRRLLATAVIPEPLNVILPEDEGQDA